MLLRVAFILQCSFYYRFTFSHKFYNGIAFRFFIKRAVGFYRHWQVKRVEEGEYIWMTKKKKIGPVSHVVGAVTRDELYFLLVIETV